MPNLKLHLDEKNYGYIDNMFSEVYLFKENGQSLVCLKPCPAGDGSEEISLMFYALTGAYYDMGQWSYIKTVGELI